MAKKVGVTMGEVVAALRRIEQWTRDIQDVLSALDPAQRITQVIAPLDEPSKPVAGICPPPDESAESRPVRKARRAPRPKKAKPVRS